MHKAVFTWLAKASVVATVLVTPAVYAADASAPTKLQALLAEAWEFDLQEDPLFATQFGDHRFNALLPRMTLADHERRIAVKKEYLQRLREIDPQSLSPSDRINHEIFRRLTADDVAEYDYRSHLIPITNREGFHVSFPELPRRVPLKTVQDVENYLSRLQKFPRYVDEHIEIMRQGIEEGQVLPSESLRGFEDALTSHIVAEPKKSLFYEPFLPGKLPAVFPAADFKRLEAETLQVIEHSIVPGYRRFLEFVKKEYVPAARGQVGASSLPRGREFYRHRVKRFTTLDVSPEEIHELGLSEVKRIKAEMEEAVQKAGFQGDRKKFVEYLRSDPRFHAQTPEQLMKEVSLVLKKMDGMLPKLFSTLPRTPYGIREIPSYIAPKTTTAYYSPPSGDGTQAGFYYVNTFNLKSRPLYEIEALSLHEAVPGHHLQIALQQELENLPPMRRFAGITVFIEGWGLYAERLGLESGFYQDPYSNFGRLSYEMWRACRLVVDTGVHYLGWTRRQAIDFMAENTALSLHNIEAEVDRYISWPGQALAYKVGELKIRELRKEAEAALQARFDVRKFHDVVLKDGAVPLSILERNVRQYIEKVKASR